MAMRRGTGMSKKHDGMMPAGGDVRRRPPVAAIDIALDRDSDSPVYRQIETAIDQMIRTGHLRDGMRLPPERSLAAQLGVDRTTVVAAYRELAADGRVAARVGRGTVITGDLGITTDQGGAVPVIRRRFPWEEVVTAQPDDDATLDDVAADAHRPGMLSLASAVPASEGYPIAEFRSLLGDALRDSGEALLQYAPPEGLPALREQIAARMRDRGADVGADNVLVCAGSQQGLYLLARALVVPGDTVLVEAPTYVGAIGVFRAADAHLVPIPRDRDGVDPARLEALLARRPVRLIYLLPTYQNPTGASLSDERRRQVLAVAARHGVPAIEDDPYGELRYEGERQATLFETAGSGGGVAYLSTFSKVLFPGFRVGWVAGAPALIERLRREKALVDLDSNAVVQSAVAQYLAQGLLDDHLRSVRPAYRERRDALIAGLSAAMPHAVWRMPSGGFSLWVELTGGLRTRDVLAAATSHGVTFVPGEVFHVDGGGRSALRLSFPALAPAEAYEAGQRLATAILEVAARRGPRREPSARIV
ncbi:MAG TPA: PLP-dependent aminotransferase family protein [Thermomicrobiales bacterium]|jgi:DNA-binding transcriptional MocR family regulator|nr:PLP-dependent aminotransferase family protein [Thermomicrobiales bacterium]